MHKIPNLRKLNHDQVKEILSKSELDCIESKPGFLDRGKKYFIIKIEGNKIKLHVDNENLNFNLKDPSWVVYSPLILYAFTMNYLRGGLVVLGWYALFQIIYRLTRPKIETLLSPLKELLIIQPEG